MAVPMVCIWIVRVRMGHRLVTVPVCVACAQGDWRDMQVPVVRIIVHMLVFMFHCLVRVLVLMAFGQMQPYPESH